MTNKELIYRMKWARYSHECWAKEQRKRRHKGKKSVPFVGGETSHRKWIKIYNGVIQKLCQYPD